MMHYITNAGLILAGCFIFYKLLLQKETFFRANRWILLACLALSFSLPLVRVPEQWSLRKPGIATSTEEAGSGSITANETTNEPVNTGATEGNTSAETKQENTTGALKAPQNSDPATAAASTPPVTNNTRDTDTNFFTWQQALTWAGWLYWFGVFVFAGNFLVQLFTLLYRAYSRPVIRDGKFRIVELSGNQAPCSFLNNIFINPEKYDWETYNQILEHEKIHIEQKHSFDLLVAELVIVFQWFNPFAWQYRKALENNLEYLTDDQLVNYKQVEKATYQLSLLKVSAPHFPLNLTTNYNQSLLKKRIAMMNVKKSNLHTAWKYCFLLPLLVLFVCLLNEPIASAHEPATKKSSMMGENFFRTDMETEGAWFATINAKKQEVSIQFKSDGDEHSNNSTTFPLRDLGELPRDKSGIFTVTREAGIMQFTGKFEGDQGMGRYKFTPAAGFAETMKKEGIELRHDKDVLVFFFVNVTHSYVKMLKNNGYNDIDRDDVIPLAALKIDEPYIKAIKASGIKGLSQKDLVPFKALGINGEYIAEIRKAGYPDVSAQQLISFKAQNIDAKYIADVKAASAVTAKPSASGTGAKPAAAAKGTNPNANPNVNVHNDVEVNTEVSAQDMISIKALRIDPEYIRSLKAVGFDNLPNHQIISMKANGVTPEYIKGLKAAGINDLRAEDVISMKALNVDAAYINSMKAVGVNDIPTREYANMKAMGVDAAYVKSLKSSGFSDISSRDILSVKALNVTPEYVKSFEALGYKNIMPRQAVSMKSLGVTSDYVKGFQDIGYKDFSLNQAVSFKAMNITPGVVKEYTDLGFDHLSLNDVLSAKSTGTTPAFISSMKEKGHNFKSLQKYVQLKTIID
ncbi:M56 family metallopeptidase [Paraflavitalea sp. CAU 1676]|uniref:M56 family metallopeptidase n=1 Tax=Paraflavitalea sp. CAU 1676 TaxID=3032598 RepID=UPI0023DAC817|nr:M56 family metallopeptidase [Paraflavitalea sp. CAU 1676]MDF2189876.1 M56 family metallopeptidase [Paraflavitalea sp. CAU 1676]